MVFTTNFYHYSQIDPYRAILLAPRKPKNVKWIYRLPRFMLGLVEDLSLSMVSKKNLLSDKKLARFYMSRLVAIHPQQLFDTLDGWVLVCNESSRKFCTRHLITYYLRHYGFPAMELFVKPNRAFNPARLLEGDPKYQVPWVY